MAERYFVGKAHEGKVLSELQQKKADRNAKMMVEKTAAKVALKKENRSLRHVAKMNFLKYEKEYKLQRQDLINKRRQAKKHGNFFIEPEAKVVFCIRLAGVNKMAPKPKKILQLLRLRQINNGTFLKMNGPIKHMLKYIDPYVTYGTPTLKTVRQLVYKRGYGKVNKQRIRLDDNRKIHDALGKFGISCMEDIVHEIYTVGPHFKECNNFLWTFKLDKPKGGFKCKRHGFNEMRGGDWGNREELINELVKRMN